MYSFLFSSLKIGASPLFLFFHYNTSSLLRIMITIEDGEDKNASISGPLRDPSLALPQEMFSQLLSFLSPQGIATSSAICKQWRESIISNPTLHT